MTDPEVAASADNHLNLLAHQTPGILCLIKSGVAAAARRRIEGSLDFYLLCNNIFFNAFSAIHRSFELFCPCMKLKKMVRSLFRAAQCGKKRQKRFEAPLLRLVAMNRIDHGF